MVEGLVGGEGFAVDAGVIRADASRHREGATIALQFIATGAVIEIADGGCR
jgi:hypothetical protein